MRITRGLAEEVGLGAGTEVSLTAKDGELVVKPALPTRLILVISYQAFLRAISIRLLIRDRLLVRRSFSDSCIRP